MGSLQVGPAKLRECDKGSLRTRLHGKYLQSAPGQKRTVITCVQTKSKAKMLPYPYHCPEPEKSPSSLKSFYMAGLYVWDLNRMSY